jgi:hypothetical protein
MTSQPNGQQLAPPPSAGPALAVPERVPWSVLGPHFQADWGRFDPAHPEPEHVEVLGPNGSGKTYLLGTMMGGRIVQRHTAAVGIATKPADRTLTMMGMPVVDDWAGVRRERHCIFWPKTKLVGSARRAYHERKIRELLERMWQPGAHVMVQLDETGYIESLSKDVRDLVQMYWREGRSSDITVLAGKQRPQGALREMHSETWWTAAFRPKDEADLERFAELFGPRREWMPIFRQLDQERREFLIRHSRTGVTFISWVDVPLTPIPRAARRQVPAAYRGHRTDT